MDSQYLTFSLRIASASNESGGSIATSESTWNMWFCTDVADSTDLLVELAALLDTEQLRNRDLDPRNRIATPDPFEHASCRNGR